MSDQQQHLFSVIAKAITEAVAIRAINKLLPAEGEGGKVMPPTFSDRQYAWEDRDRGVITLDSVASHANRQEVLLGEAASDLKLPVLRLRFSNPDQCITAYEASHRLYDANFRDARLSGKLFRTPLRAPAPTEASNPPAEERGTETAVQDVHEGASKAKKAPKAKGRRASSHGAGLAPVEVSTEGTSLEEATQDYATPLYLLGPHCLIYGCWDSTGSAGGMGARFARAIESRVTGHEARSLKGTASKLDTGRLLSLPAYHDRETLSWTVDPERAFEAEGEKVRFGKKTKDLAELNFSNIPPSIIDHGGVTITYAMQRWVLSLPALRVLRFPEKKGQMASEERNNAARTVLALLALCGLSRLWDKGLWFRSGCTLELAAEPQIEIIYGRGRQAERLSFATSDVDKAYLQAITEADKHGLTMRAGPIDLEPGQNLSEAYRRSRAGEPAEAAESDTEG